MGTIHPIGDVFMNAAAAYDANLLNTARELASLKDIESMRLYLAAHGDPVSEDPGHVVFAYITGKLAATTLELVRWLDRIPEANRG